NSNTCRVIGRSRTGLGSDIIVTLRQANDGCNHKSSVDPLPAARKPPDTVQKVRCQWQQRVASGRSAEHSRLAWQSYSELGELANLAINRDAATVLLRDDVVAD